MGSSSTENLLQEHLIVRRIGNIAQRCSDRLYADRNGITTRAKNLSQGFSNHMQSLFQITLEKRTYFSNLCRRKTAYLKKKMGELLKHYEACKGKMGGQARIKEMIRLVEYLEGRERTK